MSSGIAEGYIEQSGLFESPEPIPIAHAIQEDDSPEPASSTNCEGQQELPFEAVQPEASRWSRKVHRPRKAPYVPADSKKEFTLSDLTDEELRSHRKWNIAMGTICLAAEGVCIDLATENEYIRPAIVGAVASLALAGVFIRTVYTRIREAHRRRTATPAPIPAATSLPTGHKDCHGPIYTSGGQID